MSETAATREELSGFIGRSKYQPPISGWRILGIFRFDPSPFCLDVRLSDYPNGGYFRIHAIGAADYAVRPMDPAIMGGGPVIKFSTDDPRLADPGLQYIPGGDGEVYNPPRRYQLLELDQTWIIAVRFEIETLRLMNPSPRKNSPSAQP